MSNFLHWNAQKFLFGLILHDIPNSITHQTTFHLLPTPVGLLVLSVPPYSLPPPFFSPSRTKELAKATTLVPMTGIHYNSLLWMCTLNTLTWPDLTLISRGKIILYWLTKQHSEHIFINGYISNISYAKLPYIKATWPLLHKLYSTGWNGK